MTHDERMHQLLYSNEGRVEQCERICRLEELVRDMWDWLAPTAVGGGAPLKGLHERMRELGVEV